MVMKNCRWDGSLVVDAVQTMTDIDQLIREAYERQPIKKDYGMTKRAKMFFNDEEEEKTGSLADPDTDILDPLEQMGDDFDDPDVPAIDYA